MKKYFKVTIISPGAILNIPNVGIVRPFSSFICEEKDLFSVKEMLRGKGYRTEDYKIEEYHDKVLKFKGKHPDKIYKIEKSSINISGTISHNKI